MNTNKKYRTINNAQFGGGGVVVKKKLYLSYARKKIGTLSSSILEGRTPSKCRLFQVKCTDCEVLAKSQTNRVDFDILNLF